MRRFVLVMAGLAAGAPAQAEQPARLHGAWPQTAPAWSVTPDNPWTVMIFNADGDALVRHGSWPTAGVGSQSQALREFPTGPDGE